MNGPVTQRDQALELALEAAERYAVHTGAECSDLEVWDGSHCPCGLTRWVLRLHDLRMEAA